jgi:opacity protein-like surface antigen
MRIMICLSRVFAGATLFAGLTGAAYATDLPRRTAPPPPKPPVAVLSVSPGADWGGVYVGAQAAWLRLQTSDPNLNGFALGGRVGVDQQAGRWIYGAFLEAERTFIDEAAVKLPYRAGANVRLGYLIDRTTLAYAIAGASWLDFEVSSGAPNATEHAAGYSLGVGAEYPISGSWSAYLESRFARHYRDHGAPINASEARLGVNYRFGSSGPVVARY